MSSMTLTARALKDAGRAVREMRVNSGLSPSQLGYAVGVSDRTICRIEDGHRPRVRTMFLLASYFDCEVTDLWPV